MPKLSSTPGDIGKIVSGMVTSTNGMVRRLGGKRWQWLHRLIYLIAPLGILHFWWMRAGKSNFAERLASDSSRFP